MDSVSKRLASLREQMRAFGLDYYFVPGIDEHFSEYALDCWRRRAFVSGFTGSAGDVLVGLQGAWLWTDSRYFLQAELELEASDFTLMRQGIDPSLLSLLLDQPGNKNVGFDPKLLSMHAFQQWQQYANQFDLSIAMVEKNLVDAVWHEQPSLPSSTVVSHDMAYAGESALHKITALRKELQSHGCESTVLTALDSIAWLTNLRGQDSKTSPVFVSYMRVSHDEAVLYMSADRLSSDAKEQLQLNQVEVRSVDQLVTDLQQSRGRVWLDLDSTSQWVASLVAHNEIDQSRSPVLLMKAIKNANEQQGMREAHRRDAVAIIKLFCWLESHWRGLDEVDVADQLDRFRSEDSQYRGISFDTISAYGANSAVIHYSPKKSSALALSDDNVFLLDMGAQYSCGTTDVTRVLHFGEPTAEQKRHYTLVLKGHLALGQAIFLHGACGEHLDVLARSALWRELMNYGHGTGHGVGAYLEVHEGPQRISPGYTHVSLVPGMIVSNEPGVYFPEQYGIRIENLVLVNAVPADRQSATGDGPFYQFESLTLLPYNRDLIDCSLLSDEEISIINAYHSRVFDAVNDALPTAEKTWLMRATQAL